MFIFVLGEVGFKSLGKFTPRKHNAPPTSLAFKPDIRAETRNSPLVGAAGMLFTEAQVVVEAQVGEHKIRDWRIEDCYWQVGIGGC
jgi:hypothetical protein